MNTKQMMDFRKSLLEWYEKAQRPMPWRETTDPYLIWVSEVMLQQTQVATVIDYFNRFIERFPDIRSLAAADSQEVLKLWEGLGYYSRARNLHDAARRLAETGFTGVPDTPEAFMELPGVGPYTCAAVQSIAFNHPLAVVDGNVKRVLSRLFELETPVNDSGGHGTFAERAQDLLDTASPSLFNQALMELGALICRPTSPMCAECPVKGFCKAMKHETVYDYPRRKKKTPPPTRHYAAGLVVSEGRVLIIRRKNSGFLSGMWEFPSIPVRKKADAESICKEHVSAIAGPTESGPIFLDRIRHTYSHFKLILDLYAFGTGNQDPPVLSGHDDFRWINWSDITSFPVHKAIHKCFPAVNQFLNLSA